MKIENYGFAEISHADGIATAKDSLGFSRRTFLVTSLATGFAAASQPLLAQAISTDTVGLKTAEVSISVNDGKFPAYVAMPSAGTNLPVVVVIQEIFGVHEHIKDVCRRLAKLGYYAIAPELYARQGDVSKMTDIGEILSKVVSIVPDAQVMADIDATIEFATKSGVVDATRLGVIGFCWGGRMSWLYAHHNPKVKAAVSYYGLLDGMKNATIKPTDPVDIGSKLKVPVLGLYAGTDSFVKPAIVDAMRAELVKSGSGSEIVVFPNVNHGFHADYRPTYDKSSAQYSWKLAKDWLKERGV